MTAASQATILVVVGLGSLLVVLGVVVELLLRLVLGEPSGTVRAIVYMLWAAVLAAAGLGVVRLVTRGRRRYPLPLDSAILLLPALRQEAGEKAAGLCHLLRAGFPVAPGWVLLPPAQRRTARLVMALQRRLRAVGAENAIVRSSFPGEDGGRLFPGIYTSTGGVPVRDTAALGRALEGVAASLSRDVVGRYRRRLAITAPAPAQGALLAQEYLACEVAGVACSFHPVSRRLDQITVEVADGGVDVFSPLHGTWQVTGTSLAPEVRALLLRAVEEGERFLGGPAVVEFGVASGRPWIFQVRRAPTVELEAVWIAGGPVGLNPEALPPLHRDVLYGPALEHVGEDVMRGLGERVPEADGVARLRLGRPMVDYRAVAPAVRYRARTLVFPRGLGALLRGERTARAAVAAARAADGDPVERVRGLAAAQREVQQAAESWRVAAGRLADLLPRAVAGALQRRARRLDGLRNQLHEELVRRLEAIAPADADEALLTLAEWRGAAGDRPSAAVLADRREELRRDAAAPAPFVWCAAPDAVAPAAVTGGAELELVPLVAGRAAGTAVRADSTQPAEGNIVLLPDASLRWVERIVDAAGVVMVGQGLLGHLALLLLEAGTPTLMGLHAERLDALAGRRVRIDGHLLVVDAFDAEGSA